jgi:putative transposase
MSHSFTNLLYHVVFSTKHREPSLDPNIRSRVFEYFAGLIRPDGDDLLSVNGTADHVHLLLRMRQDHCLADLIRNLKARSSQWVRRSFTERGAFAWQAGYAAFSVSQSQVNRLRQYIARQEQHHRRRSYAEELAALLRANEIPFVEAEILD